MLAIRKEIKKYANSKKAENLQRFFKTGKGEYGEGDIFLGLTVPESRYIAKQFKNLSFSNSEKLLTSKIHEERQIALMILGMQFRKGSPAEKKKIYDFYLSHVSAVNNWDLVDGSAPIIVGGWLVEKSSKEIKITLERLAYSHNLWERRIAMLSASAFLSKRNAFWIFHVAHILIKDKHDLIQRAVGWMLREAGKRVSQEEEEIFIKKQYQEMGRTALRYAIERFPEEKRKKYLLGIF